MLIIGAKGFAGELLEAILQNDSEPQIAFYDDISQDLPELLFGKYKIVKNEMEAEKYFRDNGKRFALGTGNPRLRRKFYDKFTALGAAAVTIVSPFARIGKTQNEIQEGVNVLSNAIIESNNRIGKGVLLHVGSLISHDVEVGEFCEISPYACLLGNVKVGDFCSLGTGAIILPKIKLGNNVTVGAGAVVTKDVADNETVIGVPAKPLVK